MITKYKTPSAESLAYGVKPSITRVEVDSESEKYIWIDAVKYQRITNCSAIHDSRDLARKYLLDSLDRADLKLSNRMSLIRRNIRMVEKMLSDDCSLPVAADPAKASAEPV